MAQFYDNSDFWDVILCSQLKVSSRLQSVLYFWDWEVSQATNSHDAGSKPKVRVPCLVYSSIDTFLWNVSWSLLHSKRQNLLNRCENLKSFRVSKSKSKSHYDWRSVSHVLMSSPIWDFWLHSFLLKYCDTYMYTRWYVRAAKQAIYDSRYWATA
jgi:hypothetical protein